MPSCSPSDIGTASTELHASSLMDELEIIHELEFFLFTEQTKKEPDC